MPRALCNNHIKFVSQFYINVTSLKKMLIKELCSFDSYLVFFMIIYKNVLYGTRKFNTMEFTMFRYFNDTCQRVKICEMKESISVILFCNCNI